MSGLHIDYFNMRIVLGGPARSEEEARRRLAQVLYEGYAQGYEPPKPRAGREETEWEGLSECEYLHFSQMDERIAMKIAYDRERVPYQVKGNKIRIGIVSLDVVYQNSRKPQKWWCRVRDGRQTVDPGEIY